LREACGLRAMEKEEWKRPVNAQTRSQVKIICKRGPEIIWNVNASALSDCRPSPHLQTRTYEHHPYSLQSFMSHNHREMNVDEFAIKLSGGISESTVSQKKRRRYVTESYRMFEGCFEMLHALACCPLTAWLLAVGCWLLAVGCWLLAVGCWPRAAGCWLLAVDVTSSSLCFPSLLSVLSALL
jgi:hypothetical protein